MAEPLPAAPESRQIRVFLSSTFRDFMQERDLLVKQVFPRLRKQAQERGVEVVDVDLRWGVTQEESEQGKVIGLCLAEIDNCRPYFIGMLGERYGWIPPTNKYPALVLEQQTWLQQHVGGASVTELEILHGVLNDPKMAGRAFFYFRDAGWSRAQSEPGFVCDTPEEEAKLAALKERILASDFPVKQGLPDPKAIADQIEADLWALIEEQYPDLDQADALEREARKHASYRQSRLGVYLGQEYVDQLEALVSGGEQKILITGESGSGKSALIANWIHQHELEHLGDVVYAHHLGCSNDANAIRPLLGRMLDTASKLLKEAELITEPIQVPQDWWELIAKVAETLQDLGRWCKATGHRWIWVLDGLDRLADDDQQALPWLPLLIPEGVSVVISALECPARAILLERQFQLLEIGPLRRNEQEMLIETYLERYTKKLDADRLEQILASPLARSPLFLRVLLEELRQCGRFETLEAQIADYIRPKADGTLAVNDLYARVLARLESDCGAEPVQKALTALWASRAGLSEQELQAITGLAPLQWAPIDLALDKAFGRNGNRLVFDHDSLRIAVQDRYLPSEEQQRQVHSALADWYQKREGWDERKAEELPWQLQEGGRTNDLRTLLLRVSDLYELARQLDDREVINDWRTAKADGDGELDELIADAVEEEIEKRKEDAEDQIRFVERIAALLGEAGLYRELLLRLRTLSLELEEATQGREEESMLSSLAWLARAHKDMGHYNEAEKLFLRCLEASERLLGPEHPNTLVTVGNLAGLFQDKGDYEQAEA
ncbi:MAG: tetratricopeptide repeat protein, partial [Cyanobacteriota bacterium]|nr:tetratricopeptide repeat protein [Cyanobacteriota bacterium]